jgi:hypothetical protein
VHTAVALSVSQARYVATDEQRYRGTYGSLLRIGQQIGSPRYPLLNQLRPERKRVLRMALKHHETSNWRQCAARAPSASGQDQDVVFEKQ